MDRKKINVLVTGFTSNRGGVETFVVNYIDSIKKITPNIQFDILTYEEHPAYEEEILAYGGKIYSLPSPRHLDSRKKLDQFFRNHAAEYDVLWCNKCDLFNIDFLKMAKKYNIPKRIIHSHSSSNMHCGVKRQIYGLLHQMHKNSVSHFATDFWACSDYAANWMFSKSLMESNRVEYIPNAIDLRKFQFNKEIRESYRTELGIQNKTAYIFVGRLSVVKNPEFAVDVFEKIWHINHEAALLIAGTGELENSLKNKLEGKPFASNVQLLGMRRDVPQLLQAADCYLMPSLFEGFPVASIEAQAAGLPVFAASDGITAQAKLTSLFHFLPLANGAEGWAQEILNSDLNRQDCSEEIKARGFDIEGAAKKMLTRLA